MGIYYDRIAFCYNGDVWILEDLDFGFGYIVKNVDFFLKYLDVLCL